jgi:CO/xanthine dehydrogenase FAD-binding subunit
VYPPPIAEYFAPRNLEEALEVLGSRAGVVRLLAGGQSLMQQLRARVIHTDALVDINRIAGLDSIVADENGLTIRALVRFADAAAHGTLCDLYTALSEAAAAIGDRQVRNRGTLVGSVVNAAHWGDIAPSVAALDGSVVCVAANRHPRRQGLTEFVRAPGVCALATDELVRELRLPKPPRAFGSCYLKHGRVTQDRATVGVAAAVARQSDGTCCKARVVVGGLGAHPLVHARAVEEILCGEVIGNEVLRAASAKARETLTPQNDELASADYRAHLLGVYVPRALELAWTRSAEDAG